MDKKISELDLVTTLDSGDVLPIVNQATTKKVTVAKIQEGLATTAYVNSQDALKVDKIVGKGLSTEDYTTTEKNKLAGIAEGAEVNVNADWNAVSGDSQILNKPTIPSAQVNSDWNATSGVAQILNKPTIPSISNLVPYTGATANVDLGTHSITVKDLIVNHSSGSGDAATFTKGGSGEALKVVKTSGSGNAASVIGGVTLLDELHLNTDLADTYIASASVWNAKQDTLQSTVNIKSINGNSILGSGNLTISATASAQSPFTILANNSDLSAIPLQQVYKDIAEQTYSLSPTFTGTAPTTIVESTYQWQQVGSLVTVRVNLIYSTAGSISQVVIPLPTDSPTPLSPTGLNNTSDILYYGVGMFNSLSTSVATVGRVCFLRRNAISGFEFVIIHSTAVSSRVISLTLQYFT